MCRPGPIDRSQAHGTRLTAAVNLASGKLKMIQHTAGGAYSYNFSMGRGVKSCRNLVHAGRDYFSILHHHRSKRATSTMRDILNRQLNRFMNELVSVHSCSL